MTTPPTSNASQPHTPHASPIGPVKVGAHQDHRMPEHLNEFARFVQNAFEPETSAKNPKTLRAWLDLAEAYRITQALQECGGNRSAAARLLGIGRRTLYAKMDKLHITPTWRMD